MTADPPAEGLAALDPDPESAPTFEAPWQARAFAIAVALSEDADLYAWETFQSRLAAEIEGWDAAAGADPESVYYEQWLAALESILLEDGVIAAADLEARAAAFDAGDRTAHEFVEGDPHGHVEGDVGHDHGHDHPH